MPKLVLELTEDYDFDLLGICSHIKDYRLVWELNKVLEIDLCKDANYEIKRKEQIQSHAFFHFCDEENLVDFYLIANRSENGILIPEEKKCDYLFLIKGNLSEDYKPMLVKKIAEIKNVLATYEIEVEELKSKENLVF